MPLATGLSGEGQRKDLKSCPPDGYVVIRRMTYGERLERQGFMSKTSIAIDGNRADRRARNAQSFKAEMDLANTQVTRFEFAHLITEHNLQYDTGQRDASGQPILALLDFKNPTHVAMLDGNIGEEIDQYINEINDFESDEDTGKSNPQSVS